MKLHDHFLPDGTCEGFKVASCFHRNESSNSSPHTAALQTLADTDTRSRPAPCDTGRRSDRVRWRTGSSGSRSVCQRSRRHTGSGSPADPPVDKTHRVSGRVRPQPSAGGRGLDSGSMRTLHVAPFLHWPWQRFRSAKDNSGLVRVFLYWANREYCQLDSSSIHGEVKSTRGMCSDSGE